MYLLGRTRNVRAASLLMGELGPTNKGLTLHTDMDVIVTWPGPVTVDGDVKGRLNHIMALGGVHITGSIDGGQVYAPHLEVAGNNGAKLHFLAPKDDEREVTVMDMTEPDLGQ